VNSPKLSIATLVVDNACLVRLAGTIDESADAQAILPNGADLVVFDLDGVRRITSYGVLQWVKALKDLRARYYAFMRCRPSMVRQFNMVAGFGKHGEVLSIYLPYFCEECDQEFETLLDLKQDYGLVQAATPPEANCPRCNQPAEFDDVPKSYLAFSSDYPRPNPPELAVRLALQAVRLPPLAPAPSRQPPPPAARPSRAPGATPSDAPGFPVVDSRLHGSLAPPRDPPSVRDLPIPTTRDNDAEPARPHEDASVNRLRKLQDELDVTRDRLSKMIKDRKSKS
jgi:hypothetical protein